MAVALTNATFSGPEFRTGKKASYITSTTGMLTQGATVEDDYFLRTPYQSLTLIHPRPPSELSFTSVWNKWVTNAPYKVYPSARGGCFPYIWSLVGAPSGMTISSTLSDNSTYANRAAHGRITWASPVAGDYTFVVRCVDQLGTAVSQTVTLNVADSNAIWLDSTGVDSTARAGTKADPFAKIDNFYATAGGALDETDTRFTGKLLIVRSGTYTIPKTSGSERCLWGSNKPTSIVAYDTEAPAWDFVNAALNYGATAGSPRLEVIGMTFANDDSATQRNSAQLIMTADHLIICDHIIKDFDCGGTLTGTPGDDNPGGIRNFDVNPGTSDFSYYNQLRNIRITGLSGSTAMTGNACAIVMFGLREYEFNNIECLGIDAAIFTIVHLKHDNQFGVCRHMFLNFSADTVQQFNGAFMLNDGADLGGNEIEYCCLTQLNADDPAFALGANSGTATLHGCAIRRCTIFNGEVRLTNNTPQSNVVRGANVIQNNQGAATGMIEHAAWTGFITDESNSVTATSGLVDSNGLLTGAARTSYLNKKGWEISV